MEQKQENGIKEGNREKKKKIEEKREKRENDRKEGKQILKEEEVTRIWIDQCLNRQSKAKSHYVTPLSVIE